MNEIDFESSLKTDGFTEIATQDLQPRAPRGEHGHPFAVRGLVLSGAFIVTQDGERKVYGPGQIFDVAEGHPHDESIGPQGARVVIGRKYPVT